MGQDRSLRSLVKIMDTFLYNMLEQTVPKHWSVYVISTLLLLGIWYYIYRKVLQKVNLQVNEDVSDNVENKTAIIFLCTLVWPAALILGYSYLSKPETAKTGRTCITIFLWTTAFFVLLAGFAHYYVEIYSEEILRYMQI